MIKISNYIDVKNKAKELECNIPTSITLLPRNFIHAKIKNDLYHESTTPTLRKLFRQNDIMETPLENSGERYCIIDERGIELLLPTIFLSASLITKNPHVITLTLNIISNYLSNLFLRLPKSQENAKLHIVVEIKDGSYKELTYEGPVDGIKNLQENIKQIYDENK